MKFSIVVAAYNFLILNMKLLLLMMVLQMVKQVNFVMNYHLNMKLFELFIKKMVAYPRQETLGSKNLREIIYYLLMEMIFGVIKIFLINCP